jgi:hypothetical protein
MGQREANKYIQQLHKKQNNPYLWPDFLTGLPDKAAIIKNNEKVFPNLGKYSIAYIRIVNIHPYLIKYGPDNHADIIQWAAAILKTTSKKYKNSFVGTLCTHDFIFTCETKDMPKFLKESGRTFKARIENYYTKKDLKNKTTLSFKKKGGQKVSVGLIRFLSVIADKKLKGKRSQIIQDMGKVCIANEGTDQDIIIMNDDMISKE